jgi:hypothetical protein
MPYHVGAKGSYGCAGYPAVKEDGTVMGCHKSRSAAAGQIYAINRSEGKIGKAMVKEGDMVMAPNDDEVYVGRVVHVMTEGMLGMPGSEYALAASAEEPAILIQLFEMEEGGLEETEYFIGAKASDVMAMPSFESNEGMDKSMNGEMDDDMDDEEDDEEDDDIDKAKKPNYEEMIKPRRGGSTPANPRLYARVVQAAKDRFDVYPSAVANGWVVQEYKRRGGTYKGEGMDKKDYSADARNRMAEAGQAMPDGSFPIANRADLQNAIQSVGRAKDYAKAKAHIINRARSLNAIDMLPEDWKPGVRKTMWGGSIFDLNPLVK